LIFAITIYEQVLNLETSALAVGRATAMDVTFMMQVQEMHKFLTTLTNDSSSLQRATLRPCSASRAKKVNTKRNKKSYNYDQAVSEAHNLNLSFLLHRTIFHVCDAKSESNVCRGEIVCFSFCLGM
jgi:hypothetical protein